MKPFRSALFWDIMQRVGAIPYWCFGTSYRLVVPKCQ